MKVDYKILEFRGMNGTTPFHYSVIQVSENLYYKGYEEDAIKTTDDIGYASHISPKYANETVEFLKKFYDENGKRKREN